jgi:GMP synthase-like glutamine amidotransferase
MIEERKWVLLQHVAFEGPGLIAEAAASHGVRIDVCSLYAGERLPDLAELEGLIVMGGPMGVSDTVEHPYLLAERELIAAAITAHIPVLGVCLGAQLMAAAAQAEVYEAEQEEIGPGRVTLTLEGRSDPVLGGGQEVLPVIHWHRETFDLPAGAVLLASSEICPHQAFRIGRAAYGLQFHVEVDEPLAEGWREHLPAGVQISHSSRLQIEDTGRRILNAFFERAVESSS